MRTSLLVALLLCAVAFAEQGKRLIDFGDRQEWLSQEEVDKLVFATADHNFMDVTDYEETYSSFGTQSSSTPIPKTPVHPAYVKSLLPNVDVNRVIESIEELGQLHTRYYKSFTGVEAAHNVARVFYGMKGERSDITVTNFTYTSFPQASVITTIPGTGPHKDSIVIIGAHLDSVGSSATARSPGADDDGSGIATLFEIFRILVEANYYPDYTLQFMAYAAEEAGLLGSQGIATDYLKNNKDVYAVLQLDMTGYNDNAIGIITDYTSKDLNTFIIVLVDTYTSLKWKYSTCGYGCSDHASWNKTGVRASFPFETPFGNHNPYIHTSRDVVDNLNPIQLAEFVNLGIGFAVELAGVINNGSY